MERQWIACNACGDDNYLQTSESEGWPIGRCRRCGLVFVNPVPVFRPDAEFSEMSKGFQYTRYMHGAVPSAPAATWRSAAAPAPPSGPERKWAGRRRGSTSTRS